MSGVTRKKESRTGAFDSCFSFFKEIILSPFSLVAFLWMNFALLICEKKIFHSFVLYSLFSEEAEIFFKNTIEALSALKAIDPLRFKRAQKYLCRIAYLKSGADHYDRSLSAFIVDVFPENEPAFFASEIVHEATHGYLKSKGFRYTKKTRERHERICVKEQWRFIKKAIYSQEKYTEEEKNKILGEWNEWFAEALNTRWWESNNLKNQLDRLKGLLREFNAGRSRGKPKPTPKDS